MPGRRERHTEESLARLRDQLHAEAERHRPDTARIWARVEAAMAEQQTTPAAGDAAPVPPPRRRGGLWVVAAGLSTATVVGVTSVVVLTLSGRDDSPAVSLGRHSTGNPSTPGLPPPPDDRRTTGQDAAPGVRPSAKPGPSRPAGGQGGGNTLVSATGSPDRGGSAYWARNNLTLTVRRPLGALDVTIRIARGRWTFPAGSWTSFPGSDLRSETQVTREAIVQRYRLLPGRKVAPGTYLIGVQYRPGGRHDPARDTFTVTATGAGGGPPVILRGHF
ncbi:hypothetical protein SAMN04489712_103251 [Thermomonospora echinospora]|uniref:Uncharacterized protein n=1 Tax=Thermomonospora echinospora TaxID=1992 RepID=A0A1H5XI36_9ACTN|nr:hypothetical protein [Thermomonospora echinospora]SEG11080.1 hypothetical protein SAMN04489712_103251 [Thermomonospora echinospora]